MLAPFLKTLPSHCGMGISSNFINDFILLLLSLAIYFSCGRHEKLLLSFFLVQFVKMPIQHKTFFVTTLVIVFKNIKKFKSSHEVDTIIRLLGWLQIAN
ncbi:hypothetical protein Anas_04790 [Armadillidium nasatum]|uniref:Uncharacterized protein n=1 Tax=Armadillidium nasatum TaxID=96803 RepID=A0A5N5TJS1_9CRUS|nr:hypothetical protein Anas_04790 [Armadillidium nasatum]